MPGKDFQEAPALKVTEQKSKNQDRKRGQKVIDILNKYLGSISKQIL